MKSMMAWQLIKANYDTYIDQQTMRRENHSLRIVAQALVGITISVFAKDLSDDTISVLVTALSILIGFAFAAMFPIALEGTSGLPSPVYSEDRDDIKVIKQLAVYFRQNVSYFIPTSLVTVAVLLLQMLSFELPSVLDACKGLFTRNYPQIWKFIILSKHHAPLVIFAVSVFLIQECCYTFYRMCFTALSLLRIKEEYVANRPE